jgi:hypothetical protein
MFQRWFCNHKFVYKFTEMLPLNDEWPVKVTQVWSCSKCGKEKKVVSTVGQ